jgi:Recombination endonuclease VII
MVRLSRNIMGDNSLNCSLKKHAPAACDRRRGWPNLCGRSDMPKGTPRPLETRLAIRLTRLRKAMSAEEFARFTEADGALNWCSKCEQLLPLEEFAQSKRSLNGLSGRCKACGARLGAAWRQEKSQDEEYRKRAAERSVVYRAAWRAANEGETVSRYYKKNNLKPYGLTLERFDAMVAERRNRCDICKKRFKDKRDIHIDHDHSCCPGKRSCGECIRGLLCSACNNGLGRFRDNPAVLRRAARYIERDRTREILGAPVDHGQGVLWEAACF